MKKLALIVLAAFYFVCASGVYVHAHFCADELSSVSYFALNDNHDCGCGDEPINSGCCKDIQHFYKVDSHQQNTFTKALGAGADFLLASYLKLSWLKPNYNRVQKHNFNSHAPPPYLFAKASIIIVNSVFRI